MNGKKPDDAYRWGDDSDGDMGATISKQRKNRKRTKCGTGTKDA